MATPSASTPPTDQDIMRAARAAGLKPPWTKRNPNPLAASPEALAVRAALSAQLANPSASTPTALHAERINPNQGFPRELIWIVRHPHDHNGPHHRFTAYPSGTWSVDVFTLDRSLGPFGTTLTRGRWTKVPDTDFASQRIHDAMGRES